MKRWLVNGALIAASVLVALLLVEFTLRLVGFSNPVFGTYDDITGTKLRAGAAGWQGVEGRAYVKINSDGLRDREHSKNKSLNTIRIAILGDSMAEALQVPVESTFSSVLERQLKSCNAFGGRDVEVINFGVSGYGTAQELLTLIHRASAYSPDVVVLEFFSGNDVRNNSRELEPMKLRPFFRLEQGGLVLDNSFLNDREYLDFKSRFEGRKLFFELRTFHLLRKIKSIVDQIRSGEARAAPGTMIEPGLNDEIFLETMKPAWKEAWQVTEALIVKLHEEVVSHNGRLIIATIPAGIQSHPDLQIRKKFMQQLKVEDLNYPDKRIRALAEQEKIDAVILADPFLSFAEKNKVYLHGFANTAFGFGHINESGHRLAGELIAERLCREK